MEVDKAETRSRTLDSDLPQNSRGELKIKGQANARKSKWENEDKQVSVLIAIGIHLLNLSFME